jgi:hypothetical protein
MACLFSLPVYVHDPPARSIVQQLKAVNAASERLFPFGVA